MNIRYNVCKGVLDFSVSMRIYAIWKTHSQYLGSMEKGLGSKLSMKLKKLKNKIISGQRNLE